MEYRKDAGSEVLRERPPRGPRGPQFESTKGTVGRPRGSFAEVPAPVKPPAPPTVPGVLRAPEDFPFVEGQFNYDPFTGRWI